MIELCQTERIYCIDTSGAVDDGAAIAATDRWIDIHPDDLQSVDKQPERRLRAKNVLGGDLIVVLSLLNEDWEETVVPYLVGHATNGTGLLLPAEVVEQQPQQLSTPYMRCMINELGYGEFEQFTLPNLAEFARSRPH